MYVCILDQSGEILVHRNITTSPEAFLKIIAPYRDGIPSLNLTGQWFAVDPVVCRGRYEGTHMFLGRREHT